MLTVFNTLTGKIEPFEPSGNKKVKMFTCGPSVYRRPHIGNYRTFLYEDILQRYLEYLGYEVVRLISLTDIEDKAIVEAREAGVSVKELAEKNAEIFSKDIELLRMRNPTYRACMMACSSTAIEETVNLIKALLEKKHAYYHKHEGRLNVYYDPLKFKGFGKLSKLDLSMWPKKRRRFHKDTYPGTPWNKGDFILWHGYKEGDADHWNTEIGRGRPAWNIQDAATITRYLGSTADVACGGIDNLVRHHDYTIAIIEGVTGKEFAHYWFHGEHLFVDGEKMSKSRGNVYYPDDLVSKGYTGQHIRFFLTYWHYRKRLNFTHEKMKKKSQELDLLKDMIRNLASAESPKPTNKAGKLVESIVASFEKNMNNDLNIKAAFEELFKIVSKLNILKNQGRLGSEDGQRVLAALQKIDSVLQIIF
ncbi:MAG: class I tRNA ligase family protein [Candidatus Bathyarchaeota archaeon]|nr:MAG: class I tRNA ligase family protein [Candidatus Bathyarchaeota archaeon]